MTYTKTQWEDLPSQNSPINAENLNKIEQQLLEPAVNYIDLNLNPIHAHEVGRMAWNQTDDTVNIHHSAGVVQQVGEEVYVRVTNNTGSPFNNGDVIGLSGNGTQVVKYNASGAVPPMYLLGVATQPLANGERGRLTAWGRVRGLDTSAFDVGDILYANPVTPGD